MAKSLNGLTEIHIAKRIKEGRGQGSGANYKPWLRIHEVPSQGQRWFHMFEQLKAYL